METRKKIDFDFITKNFSIIKENFLIIEINEKKYPADEVEKMIKVLKIEDPNRYFFANTSRYWKIGQRNFA